MYKDIKIINNNFNTICKLIEKSKNKWIIGGYKEFFKIKYGTDKGTFDFNPCRYTLIGIHSEYKQGKYTKKEFKVRFLRKIYYDKLYYKFYNKYGINIYNNSSLDINN